MLESIHKSPLFPIINPRSIAFFGASNRFSAMGTNQLNSLVSLGFEGAVYPVHPREETVLGFKAYKSVLDVPEIPDVAVMVLPTAAVPSVLEECGRKGIKQAVIVSGGFKEVGGDGIALQKRLVDIAGHYHIRFIGPNCIGMINPSQKLNVTFLPYNASPGFIGMASQSGSFITQMSDYLKLFSLGFSVGISVGNEADIDLVDCLEYLAVCPNTRVIGLYIESIRRGRQFIETAREIAPHKPIVAYYVGGSEAGRRAGFSHTGAMAGPDRLYDGVFRQSGVIRAHSMTELFDLCSVLGTCPPAEGPGVIIQTHSGGPGAAAADACSRNGLELVQFSDKTLEKLAPYVPSTGSANNPVDLTFTRNPLDFFSDIPMVLMDEPRGNGMLMYILTPDQVMKKSLAQMGVSADKLDEETVKLMRGIAESIAKIPEKHQKPLICFTFRPQSDMLIQNLQRLGIPVLPGAKRAARAMAALVQYRKIQKNLPIV
jgi:acetyl-CoA synthetase (ADP-forming)